MDKSLIDKLTEVIKEHEKQTGERVTGFSVNWHLRMGGGGDVAIVDITLTKGG